MLYRDVIERNYKDFDFELNFLFFRKGSNRYLIILKRDFIIGSYNSILKFFSNVC